MRKMFLKVFTPFTSIPTMSAMIFVIAMRDGRVIPEWALLLVFLTGSVLDGISRGLSAADSEQ